MFKHFWVKDKLFIFLPLSQSFVSYYKTILYQTIPFSNYPQNLKKWYIWEEKLYENTYTSYLCKKEKHRLKRALACPLSKPLNFYGHRKTKTFCIIIMCVCFRTHWSEFLGILKLFGIIYSIKPLWFRSPGLFKNIVYIDNNKQQKVQNVWIW